jgi:20S proteasome alpha/beta subunit
MTTLVAIQNKDWCIIAADSQATDSFRKYDISPTGKINLNNGYLFASAGLCRGQNLLAFGWTPPRPPKNNLDKFITKVFIPAMRKHFIASGYDMKDDGDIASFDNDLLIGVRGVIYSIDSSYAWERTSGCIYTAGSGGSYAMGALDAYQVEEKSSYEDAIAIAVRAVEIAIRRDPYSGGKVQVGIQHRNGKCLVETLDDDD